MRSVCAEGSVHFVGESIPIRLFLAGYELTPTMRDINKKFSVRYYLNLVLIDEEERRYFKQQVRNRAVSSSWTCRLSHGMLCYKDLLGIWHSHRRESCSWLNICKD